MNIGRFNKKIEILTASGSTLNDIGETIPRYTPFVYAYASIAPVSGREYTESQKIRAETTYEITLRYRPDIKQDMRVRHKESVFEIISVLDLKGRGEFLKLICIENDRRREAEHE